MMAVDGQLGTLDALFEPRSVAVLGASARPGRPGFEILSAFGLLGAAPRIYPVTPRYERIGGLDCLPSLADAPEPIDLAVIASGGARIEEDVDAALAAGVRAIHVFGVASAQAGEAPADALTRIGARVAEAGAALLGPNSIGYVNYARGTLSTWIPPALGHRTPGSIALILQSGALYSYANAVDPRLKFSFTAQPGQEAGVTTSALLTYALSLPETRVIGLYLENVRDVGRFMAALDDARARGIPVVALKPGRTARAAASIATHTGRLAGSDAAYEALFRRCGVHRAATLDEFWATLRLFSADFAVGQGGVGVITDSGGQRSLMIDEADRIGLPLAELSEGSRERLRGLLAPELAPENPVDIWGGEEDLVGHASRCLTAVLDDPATAIGVVATEFGAADTDGFPTRMGEAAKRARVASGKPVVAACFSTRHFSPEALLALDASGVPVLDGVATALPALRHLLRHRDRQTLASPAIADAEKRRSRLLAACAGMRTTSESDALALVAAAGLPVVASRECATEDEAAEAAGTLGYPVVLKTAAQVAHKSDVGGVVLDLRDEAALRAAYRDLARRLGPAALVAPMLRRGVELALGALRDPSFGPLVMIAAGGTLVEAFNDAAFALAPLSRDEARLLLDELRVAPLLDGVRGAPPVDREAVVSAIVVLSEAAALLDGTVAEIDCNPLIAGPWGCTVADALVRLEGPISMDVRHGR